MRKVAGTLRRPGSSHTVRREIVKAGKLAESSSSLRQQSMSYNRWWTRGGFRSPRCGQSGSNFRQLTARRHTNGSWVAVSGSVLTSQLMSQHDVSVSGCFSISAQDQCWQPEFRSSETPTTKTSSSSAPTLECPAWSKLADSPVACRGPLPQPQILRA